MPLGKLRTDVGEGDMVVVISIGEAMRVVARSQQFSRP
jgi:hypothetical protein